MSSSAQIINGTEISKNLREIIKRKVNEMKEEYNIVPGLATILVGNNPASISYVSTKMKVAKALGFHEVQVNLPENTTREELSKVIKQYNNDSSIHGILVQLPLPKHIDESEIILDIAPEKDVDCFHPYNLGLLFEGRPYFVPCTVAGIIELMLQSQVKIDGADIVIVGRSNIVGKPLATLLSQKPYNATVTLVHSHTRDIFEICKRSDIIIVAAGCPDLIQKDWVKEGATVIDAGINRIGFNEKTGKYMICGDVDYEEVSKIAGKITPVPGGVGPMTITMLMVNTMVSAFRFIDKGKY